MDIKYVATTTAKVVVGFIGIGVAAYQLYDQLKRMDRLKAELDKA